MKERKGILNIEVALKKTDASLIKKLCDRINFETGHAETEDKWVTEPEMKNIMKYNVWTVEQFALITGMAVSTITNLTRPYFVAKDSDEIEVKLDVCFPFADAEGRGPKFVVRNEKSEKYIKYDL